MTETRQVRRAKEREGVRPDVHIKRHLGERPEQFPRVPKTQKEMQLHLAGKHPHLFRDPITRKEIRDWKKYWTYKGKGWTKSAKPTRSRASSFSRKRKREREDDNSS